MSKSPEQKYDDARENFAKLIKRWMTINKWSHPAMTKLSKQCLDDTAWFHSSQISVLRNGKVKNVGPKVFIALERLNYRIYRYVVNKELIPGTDSSNNYRNAHAVTVNGQPPSLGSWMELFCGDQDIESVQFLSSTSALEDD